MTETITLIQRAARAVEDQFDDNFVELLDPEGPLSSYGLSHAIARAVLEAIREPSEGMAEQAFRNGACGGHEDCWRAMIDAALKEG